MGLSNRKRTERYIQSSFINKPQAYNSWRVVVPKAGGSGISANKVVPLIGRPQVLAPYEAFTETFIAIGQFDNQDEAENAMKYVKTKFVRALLGVLKVTPDNTRKKWRYVPIQDFTVNSDLNWNVSIDELNQQLYSKYKLSQDVVDFIEEHIQSMN